MANQEECLAALGRVAARLAEVDPDRLAEHVVERTISCRVTDLGLSYRTRLHKGGLDPFELDPRAGNGSAADAQVRLSVDSDDLVAMANEELNPAKAWAEGRLRIEASIFDLLRLRKLL